MAALGLASIKIMNETYPIFVNLNCVFVSCGVFNLNKRRFWFWCTKTHGTKERIGNYVCLFRARACVCVGVCVRARACVLARV